MAVGDISDPIQFLHDAISDGLEAFGISIVEKVPHGNAVMLSSMSAVVLLRMGDASLVTGSTFQITVEVWAGVPAAGRAAQRALGKLVYIIVQVLDAAPGILYEATGSPEVEGWVSARAQRGAHHW